MKKYGIIVLFCFFMLFFAPAVIQAQEQQDDAMEEYQYKRVKNEYGSGIRLEKYLGEDAEVVIPEQIAGRPVVEIGGQCFAGNSHLKKVVIPDSVTRLGGFYCCENLETVLMGKNVKELITESIDSKNQDVYDERMSEVPHSAFGYCKSLKAIDLPESLVSIQTCAFYKCESLKQIQIPEGVDVIESLLFEHCYELSEVILSPKTKAIGSSAFAACTSLKGISLPEGLQTIENGAFMGCTSLERIDIPDTVTLLGAPDEHLYFVEWGLVFEYCTALKEVKLPKHLKEIQGYTFQFCRSLETVYFPEDLQTIGPCAFSECNLKKLVLPEHVYFLSSQVFEKNPDLKSVEIHLHDKDAKDVFIGGEVFAGCTSLERAILDIPIDELNSGMFKNCRALKSVVLPSTIQEIEEEAFFNCRNLQRLRLPVSLQKIGARAFAHTGLDSITIPKGVTVLGKQSFAKSGNLKKIVFKGKQTKIGIRVFDGISQTAIFDVPNHAITTYRKRLEAKNTGYNSKTMKIR